MNRKGILEYFSRKDNSSSNDTNNAGSDDVTITRVFTPATANVNRAEVALAEDELKKSYKRPQNYQSDVPVPQN